MHEQGHKICRSSRRRQPNARGKEQQVMIKSASPEPDQVSGSPVALLIEEISDPAEIARCRAQHERAQRNTEWLEAHWPDLLPQARGNFLAVAGQQALLAATAA